MIAAEINNSTFLPKYQKVYHFIAGKIRNGEWQKGSKLPSIMELSLELDLSKDTVCKAYQELHQEGIINSVPRRGYFVQKDLHHDPLAKILLLIPDVTFENKSLYDAMIREFGDQAELFTYCCHSDTMAVKNFLREKFQEFDYYILSPFNTRCKIDLVKLASNLPGEKQLAIFRQQEGEPIFDLELLGDEIYRLLQIVKTQISSYRCLNLVLPENSGFHFQTICGFQKFCEKNGFEYKMLDGFEPHDLRINEFYFVLDDQELFQLIKSTRQKQLELGYDIGVLSLNEEPFKEFLAHGVSTVRFNFSEIARKFAANVLQQQNEKVVLRLDLVDRKSF